MKKALALFKNKYFLATLSFLCWMSVFDRNDLMSQFEYHRQLKKLRLEKEFYTNEVSQVKQDLDKLNTNRETLERMAREKYLMKKDNEDVYVIIKRQTEKKRKSLF